MSPRRAAVLRAQPHDHGATLREHLVASTEQLLGHHSLGELTTRSIAQHAGVSDGVLYNHFEDKHELVTAAMLRRYARLVERLEDAAPVVGEGTVLRNVQAFARALAEVESDVLLHGAALLLHPDLLHRFWADIHRTPFGIDRLRRPLVDYLEGEQALGRVRADLDVGAAVTVVFGVSAMVALTGRVNPGAQRDDLGRQLEAAVAAAVTGFETQ